MILFEFAEVVASVLIQSDDAMSVAVCIFILEKGAFAAFAGLVMFYSFCELFIIFIFNFSRRLSDESDLPDFGAADIFKDYDGNISVSLASNQPTSGRDADLNLIGAFHSISRFLRNTSISFCRLCRTYARIGAFVR